MRIGPGAGVQSPARKPLSPLWAALAAVIADANRRRDVEREAPPEPAPEGTIPE